MKHPVESRPDVMGGAPVLRGTRITTQFVVALLDQGVSLQEFAEEYDLSVEQVAAAVAFEQAADRLGAAEALGSGRRRVPASG